MTFQIGFIAYQQKFPRLPNLVRAKERLSDIQPFGFASILISGADLNHVSVVNTGLSVHTLQ